MPAQTTIVYSLTHSAHLNRIMLPIHESRWMNRQYYYICWLLICRKRKHIGVEPPLFCQKNYRRFWTIHKNGKEKESRKSPKNRNICRHGTWIVTYEIVFFFQNGCQIQNGGHKHEIIVFFINDLMSILLKISAPIFRNYQIINNYAK